MKLRWSRHCALAAIAVLCIGANAVSACDDTPPLFEGITSTGLPILLNATEAMSAVPFSLKYNVSHDGGSFIKRIVFTLLLNRESDPAFLPRKTIEIPYPTPDNPAVSNSSYTLNSEFYPVEQESVYNLYSVYLEDGVGNSITQMITPLSGVVKLVGHTPYLKATLVGGDVVPTSGSVHDAPFTFKFTFDGQTNVAPLRKFTAVYTCPTRPQATITLFEDKGNPDGTPFDPSFRVVRSVAVQKGTWPCTYMFSNAIMQDDSATAIQVPGTLSAVQAALLQTFPMNFTLRGPADTVVPTLKSFKMSQAVVTTTLIDQTVNFTIEASDDFGVMDINIYTSDNPSMPTFVLTPANRVSGDTRNGVYVLPLKFNAHYPTRVYRITQIQVRDFAFNTLNHTIEREDVNTATLYVDCCCKNENERDGNMLYQAMIIASFVAIFIVGVLVALRNRHRCDPNMRSAPSNSSASSSNKAYSDVQMPDASSSLKQGLLADADA